MVMVRGKSMVLLICCVVVGVAQAGCDDGGTDGCAPPQGDKWDRWDMAGSTYTYCFGGCPIPWLIDNTKALGLGEYGGVVGVDHYWTHQGTPCVNGEPREFAAQGELARTWKAKFPNEVANKPGVSAIADT